MQATLPIPNLATLHTPPPVDTTDLKAKLGPIGRAAYEAVLGTGKSITVMACAKLGEAILKAAGNDAYTLPLYGKMLIPALIVAPIYYGSIGFVQGYFNPTRETC